MTDFQRKVRDNYEKLRDDTWVTVSADGSMEEVGENLYKVVEQEVARDKSELGRLWVEARDGDSEPVNGVSPTR